MTRYVVQRKLTIEEFEEAKARGSEIHGSLNEVEETYWRHLLSREKDFQTLYGNDLEFSSFGSKETCSNQWNLRRLSKLSGGLLKYTSYDIPGVVRPYSYVGSQFSTFCWHVEDDLLYSINYLHDGSSKVWYAVPGDRFEQFEGIYQSTFPRLSKHHGIEKKTSMMDPSILVEAGIPVCKLEQKSREFVVTFPKAYHAGFNCGINYAEAVNFADDSWLSFGEAAYLRNKANKIVPTIPFVQTVIRAADSFWSGDLNKRFQALSSVTRRECRARSEFRLKFHNVRRSSKRDWFQSSLCYCDNCKEFLYLSVVRIKRSVHKAQDVFLCLDCAIKDKDKPCLKIEYFEQFSDNALRMKVMTLRKLIAVYRTYKFKI
ncbi:hypothetical protein AAMO2058_001124300 [Amorphochlora amoebiformis]